jgi:hypothetical protein
MTLNDLQRAELALFAARAAGPGASLEQMKAICYCIRNRVKQGWHDGQWLTVTEHADEAAGNLAEARTILDISSRPLQRLVADVDDIYYGMGNQGPGDRDQGSGPRTPTAQSYSPAGGDLEHTLNRSCYWARVDQPFTPWFRENILDRPDEHPMRAQMGMMAFFE